MLHQELMFKYSEADLALPVRSDDTGAGEPDPGHGSVSALRLVLHVCGNVVVGTGLIGALLMAPHALARLLGLF